MTAAQPAARSRARPVAHLAAAFAAAALPGAAAAFDYPTSDRVVYVESCVRDHPGPHFEMVNKCSCAIDALARKIPYDDFVQMTTALNANTIGGERGAYIRDVELLQKQIRDFRTLQTQAFKDCFVNATGPR